MKYVLRFVLILHLICFILASSTAQVIRSNFHRERNFAFEVKLIDEFFERFNYNTNTLFTSYLKKNYPNIVVDRKSLLISLFNRQDRLWEKEDLDDFFNQVTDPVSPVYLNFYGNDWYAETVCSFKYKGKPTDVVVLLKIQTEPNGGSKWTILSAFSRLILSTNKSTLPLEKNGVRKFLNPMTHATNFIGLSRAFNDVSNVRDYLDTNFLRYALSREFLRTLLNNELEFQFVKDIKYHFLQVNGWIFTIKQYTRNSINSGWLISSLQRATNAEKKTYLDKLFH